MNEKTKARVRERAAYRSEFCQLSQSDSPLAALRIEHIIPKFHGGSDALDNLALACIDCNLHKGPNLTGIDPDTDTVTELFHPRRDRWIEHFEQRGIYLIAKTAVGRTTIRVLNMNSEDQLALRYS